MLSSKAVILFSFTAFLAIQAYAKLVFEKQDLSEFSKEIQAEEAQRTPKLTKPTTLAGIAMPAGTQLELLHKNSEGEQWIKPEYFEKAFFPTPVMWQGVPITAMWRRLETDYDYDKFKTVKIKWGDAVETTLAKPTVIQGFNCHKELNWRISSREIEDFKAPVIDAKLSSPKYFMDSCTSNGQTFRSKNGKMQVVLKEGSRIFSNRWLDGSWLDTDLPKKSLLDVWTANNDDGNLQTSLFMLKGEKDFGLDKQDKSVIFVFGDIETGTAECPLKKGSYVQWRCSEPDSLLVYKPQGVTQCGSLKVKNLKTLPKRIKWMTLEPSSEQDGK